MTNDAQPAELTFESVFRRHFDYVWRCARAVVGEGTADDVTQEAFLVVRRRLSSFSGGSIRAWLFAIVRNVARNRVRGQRRHDQHLRAVPEPSPAPMPDEQLALRQAADRLDAFMATLPATQRDAFVLMEVEGLTAAEVARAVGSPVQTIYSRLRAARKAFTAFVDETEIESETERGMSA